MNCGICGKPIMGHRAFCDNCVFDEARRQQSLAAPAGSAAELENKELRIMLAIAHAGLDLYTDGGELQDNRMSPFIDFKRDSVGEIERKLHERMYARKQQNAELCHGSEPLASAIGSGAVSTTYEPRKNK